MPEIKDKKPGLQERYGRAVNATRLKVEQTRITDIDSLIAAGWVMGGAAERRRQRQGGGQPERNKVAHALAPLLFRLNIEWDLVNAEERLALTWQAKREEAIKELAKDIARRLLKPIPTTSKPEDLHDSHVQRYQMERDVADLESMRKVAKTEAANHYRLMLTRLRTLPDTREVLWRWACIEASRFPLRGKVNGAGLTRDPQSKQWREPTTQEITRWVKESGVASDEVVRNITARVLRALLDKRCYGCGGSGLKFARPGRQKTGYGAVRPMQCDACHGSGDVSESLGDTEAEKAFARHLLERMKVMVLVVERDMRHFIHATERST